MRNLVVYLLLIVVPGLVLFTCSKKKKPVLFASGLISHSGSWRFTYGESPSKLSDEIPLVFGPEIKKSGDAFCLLSHSEYFRDREWGPVLELCFENSPENDRLLTEAVSALRFHFNNERPEGYLAFGKLSAHLNFLSVTEIVNKLEKETDGLLWIGDKKLHNSIEKEGLFQKFNYFSIKGNANTSFETSFSRPYFSILKTGTSYQILYPVEMIGTPVRSIFYLSIEIPEEGLKELADKIVNVSSQNEIYRKNCNAYLPDFTEILTTKDTPSGRFLELKFNTEEFSCGIKELFFGSISYEVNGGSGFHFPGSVKLLVEEESTLPGMIVSLFPWADIKAGANLSLQANGLLKEWSFIENPVFRSQEDVFSLKKETPGFCSVFYFINSVSHFCADPGYEENLTNPDSCSPDDFSLSEINPFGLMEEGVKDYSGKFIELQYRGKVRCDMSSLLLQIEGYKTPLFLSRHFISEGEFLVIGRETYFQNLPHLSLRDPEHLKLETPASLLSLDGRIFEFYGGITNGNYIAEDSSKKLHSLIPISGGFEFHREKNSSNLKGNYSSENSMSPGEENPPIGFIGNSKISEINWAGSFSNSLSYPEDDFLELETEGYGTVQVTVINDGLEKKYFLPVLEFDDFPVLHSGEFKCFNSIKNLYHADFSLPASSAKISVSSNSTSLDEMSYNPVQREGVNDSSLRIRRSFAKTKRAGKWKNSDNQSSGYVQADCKNYSFGTPGGENETFSYLFPDTNSFTLNFQKYYESVPINVKYFTAFPSAVEAVSINILQSPSPFNINIPGSFSPEASVYLEISGSDETNLINRDGLFISGVNPSPINSANEWVLLCNRSENTKNLYDYFIEDTGSFDEIVTYQERKGVLLPSGVDPIQFTGNQILLKPASCAYFVDPDANSLVLQPIGELPVLVTTVKTSTTIGNGISDEEPLDLYKKDASGKIHIHSYGNRYSGFPIKMKGLPGEVILLKENKTGILISDYEVKSW